MRTRGPAKSRTSEDPESCPPLFALAPERPELMEALTNPNARNGHTTLKDGELVSQMAALFAEGRGCKAVSRLCGVGVQTARAVRNHLSTSGKLLPWKERVSKRMGEVIEDGVDVLHDGILSGEISAKEISVPLGILVDKKQILDGGPTSIVLHQEEPVSAERLAGRLDELIRQLPAADRPLEVATVSQSVAAEPSTVEPQEVIQP